MMKGPTIGISGGIGAGKSIVSRLLRCNGFKVYDCDTEAKRIMILNPLVKSKLIDCLGKDIYLPDGNLDRKKVAEEIFSDSQKRQKVNEIVHAAVKKDIESVRLTVKSYFFIESAILASGGLVPLCDEIWVVEAPFETRIKRIEKRDGWKKEDIIKRIESQKQELELLPENEIVILENNDRDNLLTEVLLLVNKYNKNQYYEILC